MSRLDLLIYSDTSAFGLIYLKEISSVPEIVLYQDVKSLTVENNGKLGTLAVVCVKENEVAKILQEINGRGSSNLEQKDLKFILDVYNYVYEHISESGMAKEFYEVYDKRCKSWKPAGIIVGFENENKKAGIHLLSRF